MELLFSHTYLSTEEWISLNDIQDEKILELADIEHEHDELVRKVRDYTPVTGDMIDDVIRALVIRGIDYIDIVDQLEHVKARLDHNNEEYNNLFFEYTK